MTQTQLISCWIGIGLVYLAGLFAIDIMDVDAAQYANISTEMLQGGSWLEIKHKGADYLDKPPLLFWLSSISFQLFGYNSFAFRLPSFLSTILGFYATFQLGRRLYNKEVGMLAALLLASTQAWILFNHDVRTDTLLSNFVVVAIWQLFVYLETRRGTAFLLGFAAVGLAMLAKGPIGAVIPAAAIGSYLLAKRQWRQLFQPQWLLGILVILAVLSPMIYGLWSQFGKEGVYFFFWKQSFGRITGENVWKDDSDAFFFVHTFFWSFLPWTVLALWALGKRLGALLMKGPWPEMLTLGGFILPFIALSMSHYKLPHYIFPMYPLMAILTAQELQRLMENSQKINYKIFLGLQLFVNILILTTAFILIYYVFPSSSIWLWGVLIVGLLLYVFILFNKELANYQLYLPTLSVMLLLNFVLNIYAYPQLLKYQSGSQAAAYINKQKINTREVAVYASYPNSLDFYMHDRATVYEDPAKLLQDIANGEMWLFTDTATRNWLEEQGVMIKEEVSFPHFHVTKLSLKFLNPNTRDSQLGKRYLLKVGGVLS